MSQGSTTMQAVREVPDFAARFANLANARLGATVVSVTDEFFGARDRLIRTEEPSFDPDLEMVGNGSRINSLACK